MILVLLGTQNNSFDRLLKEIEKNIQEGIIKDNVIVQAGYTNFKSDFMEVIDFIPKEELLNLQEKADLIITHGGVASIISSLKLNKKVIAVARLSKYLEHVNNHQIEIVKTFNEKKYLIGIEDVEELGNAVIESEKFIAEKYESDNNKLISIIEEFIDNGYYDSKVMDDNVDILLTVYKTNINYLKQQIDSILNQSYKNFNLIISDDCSNDNDIKELLEEYSDKNENVTVYFQEENLGYNKNFEFLLSKSISNYIMFGDHDDIWFEEKVEKSLRKIKKMDVDMVYCNCIQVNENGEKIQDNYFKYKNVPLVKGKENVLAISRCIGIGCSQIITKSVKEKMLPFKNLVIAHDWLASFIANQNKGIDYIEERLFGYRLHTNNVFGGRSLSQNLSIWKQENGKSYKAFLKYRNEKVIDKAYLDGAKMCLDYSQDEETKRYLEKMVKYYESLKNSKYINIHMIKYFKFLSGKNLLKKMIKELLIFHVPILGFLVYLHG